MTSPPKIAIILFVAGGNVIFRSRFGIINTLISKMCNSLSHFRIELETIKTNYFHLPSAVGLQPVHACQLVLINLNHQSVDALWVNG